MDLTRARNGANRLASNLYCHQGGPMSIRSGQSGFPEAASIGPKSICGDDIGTCQNVVLVDFQNHLGGFPNCTGRPERQIDADSAPVQFGTHGAVQNQGRILLPDVREMIHFGNVLSAKFAGGLKHGYEIFILDIIRHAVAGANAIATIVAGDFDILTHFPANLCGRSPRQQIDIHMSD